MKFFLNLLCLVFVQNTFAAGSYVLKISGNANGREIKETQDVVKISVLVNGQTARLVFYGKQNNYAAYSTIDMGIKEALALRSALNGIANLSEINCSTVNSLKCQAIEF